MKPIDFRNATFEDLRALLAAKREAVWLDWLAYEVRHGVNGATTRQVCEWARRDILQFRPRCTELYQMGVLMLVEEGGAVPPACQPGVPPAPKPREGLYITRPLEKWQEWCAEQQRAAISGQLQMAI